jgi:hypothetical protein
MAIRWRVGGKLLCAAKSEEKEGDTYINDRLHYELSVIQKVLVPAYAEGKTGEWRWLHGECNCDDGSAGGCFVRAERWDYAYKN